MPEMLDQLTQPHNKLVQLRREASACSRVSHAKSLNIPQPSQESTDQPKLPSLALTSSPTRNIKTPAQPQPLSESQLLLKRNTKSLISVKINLFH